MFLALDIWSVGVIMLEAEKEALRNVSRLEDDIIKIIETRSRERTVFKLKIDSLDWDRNHGIRRLLQNEVILCLYIRYNLCMRVKYKIIYCF